MSLKTKIINNIIDTEGGYTNDINDSGGETKFGITKSTAIAYGYMGDMKKLDREIAFEIYSKSFWDSQRLSDIEKLSPAIAEEIADTGVNMHPIVSAKFLQRCLNLLNYRQKFYRDIRVDGYIGKKTIYSLSKYLDKRGKDGEKVLLSMLNTLQGAKYISLAERREKDETFIYGWFHNRVILPIHKVLKDLNYGS